MAAVTIGYGGRPLGQVIYWRRRLVALLVFAGLAISLVTVAGRLGRDPHIASGPGSFPTELVAQRVHVVVPGDTLWTIARSFQPSGDVRPLVQQLADSRRGAALQVGERIELAAAREVTAHQR